MQINVEVVCRYKSSTRKINKFGREVMSYLISSIYMYKVNRFWFYEHASDYSKCELSMLLDWRHFLNYASFLLFILEISVKNVYFYFICIVTAMLM